MKILDLILYGALRIYFFLICALPERLSLKLISLQVRIGLCCMPQHKRVAMKNLMQAFPDLSDSERKDIFARSCNSLARLIYDFSRLHNLDLDWVKKHVEIPRSNEVDKILKAPGRKSAMYVTGHLGSFELLAHSANLLGYPSSFIVRNFKNKYVDSWWNARRESKGNIVINRSGAFRRVVAALEQGIDVGILFDQNIKRRHAFFVDFFGRKAATTKTVGIAAVKTEAIIIVVSMQYLEDGRYRINWEHKDFSALYGDKKVSAEEKAIRLTQSVTTCYEEMIRRDPGAWFWLHRRWRTVPEGESEHFYRD